MDDSIQTIAEAPQDDELPTADQPQEAEKPRREMPLARKVGRMGMLIHRYYDEQAHRHGGTGDPLRGQGRILALLSAKPQTTQRELSYLLDMRQQSLSELLSKLEEKGFITREKSADDGRVTVVRLTEAGAAAAPSPDDMRDHADALDCLTDEERTQLEALTDKLTASLEEKLVALGIDPNQRPPRRPDGPPRGPEGRRGDGAGHGRGQGGPRDGRGRGRDERRDGGRRDERGYGNGGGRGRGYGGGRDFDRKRDDRRGPRGNDDRGHRGPYRPDGGRDDHRMRQA